MFAQLLLVILLWLIFLKAKKIYRDRRMVATIPSPPTRYFLGHVHLLTAKSESFLLRAKLFAEKYYPIYRYSILHKNIVHFLDPEDIKMILSSSKHLTKGHSYNLLQKWLGTGLLTSTGEKWYKRRKILTPAFHFTILQEFIQIFHEETNKLIENLNLTCGEVIDIVPPITDLTLQSVAETAMGFNSTNQESQNKYKEAVYEMGSIIFKRVLKPWYFIDFIYRWSALARKETQVVNTLHDFSYSIIYKREKEMSHSTKKRIAMLDLLLTAKMNGMEIDYEGIREEVDTFTFEGHDTTGMALTYLFLVLANLPDMQNNVLQEILAVTGPSNAPSYEELHNLKFTDRVIKETLRLFPSVPFISRIASEDFVTKTGHAIPKGTALHIHVYSVHRHPNIYPDPLRFDPDRFLPENANQRHPFAYIPFSAGPRNCIGQKFAFLELKMVLCGVLRRFKLEKVDDMHEIQYTTDLVLRPKNEVKVRFILRT